MTVKIYSTPTCAYCGTLKEYLHKQNVAFEDIDVSVDEKALNEMVEKTQQMGVPVIDIGGQIVIGFDKKRINQLLNIIE